MILKVSIFMKFLFIYLFIYFLERGGDRYSDPWTTSLKI